MKLTKILALSSLLLGAVTVGAQQDNTLSVTLSVRIVTQSTNITDAHNVTTTPAPKTRFVSINDLVRRLAQDEFNAGNWPSNSFPRGAKLVVVNGGFVIVKGTNTLVDVSNVIGIAFGTNTIMSGRQNDTNGLASPTITEIRIARLIFDDVGINPTDGLRFYLQGVLTETITDSALAKNGTFTQTHSVSMPNSAGEGESGIGSGDERPIIVTGSLSAFGTGRLLLVP
ncbi:MAG: hypothetical protein ACXWBP_02740 [Limisphaerales bacterium]